MGEFSLAGEGALWAQPDGPNTTPMYLGCHEIGDIQQALGDVKLYYCPNPGVTNDWVVSDSSKGSPGLVTTTVSARIKAVKDALDKMLRCPGAIFVHHVACGKPSSFDSWDYSYLLKRPHVTQRTLSKLTSMTPDNQDQAMKQYAVSAESMSDLYKLVATQIATDALDNLNDVTSCDLERCDGNCGDAEHVGDTLWAGSGSQSGSPVNQSEILQSVNAGGSWTPATQYAFLAGETVAAVRCFTIDEDSSRIIAIRGTTDPANPAEWAFSDDGGATWTHVDLGTVNGTYALGPKSLMVLDYYNIWAVTSGGHIFFSNDGGATATEVTSPTAQDLYAIHMSSEQYGWIGGANNTILKTTQRDANGINIWSTVVGPTAQAAQTVLSVHGFDSKRAWISYNDGELWFVRDGGLAAASWTMRSIAGVTAGSMPYVTFYDEWVGLVIHNNNAGVGAVYMTINGGNTWKSVGVPANAGLNSIVMPTPTLAVAVGNVYGGTAMIIRMAGGE